MLSSAASFAENLTVPYEKIKAGEWLRPKVKGFKMACCDCGLVHTLDFRVHTGRAEFRAYRDTRATKRLRARAVTNTAVVAGPKPVTANQHRPGATRDRLSVSNNRRSKRRNEQL